MKNDERGVALIITMFLLATLSALAVSMMFLAQTETASSRNYRTMSQARYAAESGVQEMANYLMNTGYVPAANVNTATYPVSCTGGSCSPTGSCTSYGTIAAAVASGCVVVGYSAATTNNPAGLVRTPTSVNTLAVNSSGTTSNAAMGTVTFAAAAILLSQKSIPVYGSSTPGTIQTWQIIADGTVPPSTSAIVEVTGTMERGTGSAQTFAVFATDPNCGAIVVKGNASTDSYSSQSATDMATTPPVHTGTGHSQGGIGTNGNLDVSGSVGIGGTLTTPRTGSGACSNSNPNAITGTGSWTYGGTNHITSGLTYPTPDPPSPTPPTTSASISSGMGAIACTAAVAGSLWTCSISGTTVTLSPPASAPSTPLTLGNLTVGSNTNLVIAGGSASEVVNVNSFKLGSNATMSLGSSTNVTMNIAGNSLGSTLPMDLSGGGTVNPSYDPSRLQITYGGTAEIDTVGNNTISATIYAPNAFVKTVGNGNLYGSILASTFQDTGGAAIHYDTSLSSKMTTLGNYVLTSFSWKKY